MFAVQEAWVCSVPGLGRSPGEGKGYPLQYSGLENSMNCIMGSQRVGHNWATFHFLKFLHLIFITFPPLLFFFYFKLLWVISLVLKLLQMEFKGPKPGRSFGNTVVLQGFWTRGWSWGAETRDRNSPFCAIQWTPSWRRLTYVGHWAGVELAEGWTS